MMWTGKSRVPMTGDRYSNYGILHWIEYKYTGATGAPDGSWARNKLQKQSSEDY